MFFFRLKKNIFGVFDFSFLQFLISFGVFFRLFRFFQIFMEFFDLKKAKSKSSFLAEGQKRF